MLTVATVGICLVVGVLVTNARRFVPTRLVGAASRAATIGYAVPGPVVGDGRGPHPRRPRPMLDPFGRGLPGTVATGSFLALVYAYGVRFLAPSLTSVESGLDQVPDDLTSSARSLGAAPVDGGGSGPPAADRRRAC